MRASSTAQPPPNDEAAALRAQLAADVAKRLAATTVPSVEEAIAAAVNGANEAGRCSALGHAYLITKDPFWTVPVLRNAIARDKAAAVETGALAALDEFRRLIKEAGVPGQPATVGGLLATAPVGSIVEWCRDGEWYQMSAGAEVGIAMRSRRWYVTMAGGYWSRFAFIVDATDLRLHARRVPARLFDADPATRGELGVINHVHP